MTNTKTTPGYIFAAQTAHEVNREYCIGLGDDSQASWNDVPLRLKESAIAGVRFVVDNPDAGPEALHESWLAQKLRDGWVYGEVKDADKKTHPCLVDYADLPVSQRMKDELFRAVVRGILGV